MITFTPQRDIPTLGEHIYEIELDSDSYNVGVTVPILITLSITDCQV